MMEETLQYPEKFKIVILNKKKYSLLIFALVGCYAVLTGS
jgi:hypothetical protein